MRFSAKDKRVRRSEVLFIDARKLAVMISRVQCELTDAVIDRIAGTVAAWRGEAGASDCADVAGYRTRAQVDRALAIVKGPEIARPFSSPGEVAWHGGRRKLIGSPQVAEASGRSHAHTRDKQGAEVSFVVTFFRSRYSACGLQTSARHLAVG